MYRFKVKVGSFVDNGREYKRGDVVESEEDLNKKFVNAFEPLGLVPDKIAPKASSKAPKPSETYVGDDVTAQFPLATKASVIVREIDGLYYVYHTKDPLRALNVEGLKKSQVPAFIRRVS